jgi:V-type H+-transporting ATPase subunit C
MHNKAIRVFVESVLCYGLPVDFTTVLYEVHTGEDHQLTQKLDVSLGIGGDDEADEGGEECHDFVLLKFEPNIGVGMFEYKCSSNDRAPEILW